MTVTAVFIFLVILLGAFTQSLTGFGVSLVVMPALSLLLGVELAAPIGAIIAMFVQLILLRSFRDALNPRSIVALALSTVIAVPIGIYGLSRIDENLLLTALGIILVGYSLYALLRFRLPALSWSGWAYLFGFAGGLLGGAYNTAGPPYVIYGNCRGWQPAVFKGNLQALFMISGGVALLVHALSGNLTLDVARYALLAVPAILIGIWLGLRLDKRLNPHRFEQLVLVLLLVIGVRLLL